MSSISSPEIITKMLRNNGTYPGDPQCASIWSYRTPEGGTCYKLINKGRTLESIAEFITSPWVEDPTLLWATDIGLTLEGKALIKQQNCPTP